MPEPRRVTTKKKAKRLLLIILFVFPGIFSVATAREQWFGNPEMNRLFVLLNAFFKEDVFAPGEETTPQLAALYIRKHDPYAAVYSPEEYQAFKRSFSPVFGGVQMDIQELADKRIICHPARNGKAFAAGIKDGDRLVAIDGKSCAHTEIHLLAMKIRGEPDSPVTLTVQTAQEPPRKVTITRTLARAHSVWQEQIGRHNICKIHRFSNETARELRGCVTALSNTNSLILDLRGNAGGDLDAAIEAASMFLPKESEIVTLVGATTKVVNRSQDKQLFKMPAIILLQNAQTASAAEVFIAALVQNKRAISLGTQSFGKGAAQKFVELHDGSAMLLSYARLLPPGKRNYHGTGLPPTIPAAAPLIRDDTAALSARLDTILDDSAARFP